MTFPRQSANHHTEIGTMLAPAPAKPGDQDRLCNTKERGGEGRRGAGSHETAMRNKKRGTKLSILVNLSLSIIIYLPH